uniref:Chitin-binding type-2 domain-containing protein n=1 Tax=Biomphalaria glabrata TaxID=6526 RepID=A0A2C9K6B2_BIOGL
MRRYTYINKNINITPFLSIRFNCVVCVCGSARSFGRQMAGYKVCCHTIFVFHLFVLIIRFSSAKFSGGANYESRRYETDNSGSTGKTYGSFDGVEQGGTENKKKKLESSAFSSYSSGYQGAAKKDQLLESQSGLDFAGGYDAVSGKEYGKTSPDTSAEDVFGSSKAIFGGYNSGFTSGQISDSFKPNSFISSDLFDGSSGIGHKEIADYGEAGLGYADNKAPESQSYGSKISSNEGYGNKGYFEGDISSEKDESVSINKGSGAAGTNYGAKSSGNSKNGAKGFNSGRGSSDKGTVGYLSSSDVDSGNVGSKDYRDGGKGASGYKGYDNGNAGYRGSGSEDDSYFSSGLETVAGGYGHKQLDSQSSADYTSPNSKSSNFDGSVGGFGNKPLESQSSGEYVSSNSKISNFEGSVSGYGNKQLDSQSSGDYVSSNSKSSNFDVSAGGFGHKKLDSQSPGDYVSSNSKSFNADSNDKPIDNTYYDTKTFESTSEQKQPGFEDGLNVYKGASGESSSPNKNLGGGEQGYSKGAILKGSDDNVKSFDSGNLGSKDSFGEDLNKFTGDLNSGKSDFGLGNSYYGNGQTDVYSSKIYSGSKSLYGSSKLSAGIGDGPNNGKDYDDSSSQSATRKQTFLDDSSESSGRKFQGSSDYDSNSFGIKSDFDAVDQAEDGSVCKSGSDFAPHPTSCDKFYQCANGKPFMIVCPKGLVFNTKYSICDWPSNVDCPSDSDIAVLHLPSSRHVRDMFYLTKPKHPQSPKPLPSPPKAPKSTIKLEPLKLQAMSEYVSTGDEGHGYSKEAEAEKKGSEEENDVSYYSFSEGDIEEDESGKGNDWGKNSYSAAAHGSQGVVCSYGVKFIRDPNDCTKFYQCAHSKPFLMTCPAGLYFNTDIDVCDWPSNVDCSGSGQTRQSTSQDYDSNSYSNSYSPSYHKESKSYSSYTPTVYSAPSYSSSDTKSQESSSYEPQQSSFDSSRSSGSFSGDKGMSSFFPMNPFHYPVMPIFHPPIFQPIIPYYPKDSAQQSSRSNDKGDSGDEDDESDSKKESSDSKDFQESDDSSQTFEHKQTSEDSYDKSYQESSQKSEEQDSSNKKTIYRKPLKVFSNNNKNSYNNNNNNNNNNKGFYYYDYDSANNNYRNYKKSSYNNNNNNNKKGDTGVNQKGIYYYYYDNSNKNSNGKQNDYVYYYDYDSPVNNMYDYFTYDYGGKDYTSANGGKDYLSAYGTKDYVSSYGGGQSVKRKQFKTGALNQPQYFGSAFKELFKNKKFVQSLKELGTACCVYCRNWELHAVFTAGTGNCMLCLLQELGTVCIVYCSNWELHALFTAVTGNCMKCLLQNWELYALFAVGTGNCMLCLLQELGTACCVYCRNWELYALFAAVTGNCMHCLLQELGTACIVYCMNWELHEIETVGGSMGGKGDSLIDSKGLFGSGSKGGSDNLLKTLFLLRLLTNQQTTTTTTTNTGTTVTTPTANVVFAGPGFVTVNGNTPVTFIDPVTGQVVPDAQVAIDPISGSVFDTTTNRVVLFVDPTTGQLTQAFAAPVTTVPLGRSFSTVNLSPVNPVTNVLSRALNRNPLTNLLRVGNTNNNNRVVTLVPAPTVAPTQGAGNPNARDNINLIFLSPLTPSSLPPPIVANDGSATTIRGSLRDILGDDLTRFINNAQLVPGQGLPNSPAGSQRSCTVIRSGETVPYRVNPRGGRSLSAEECQAMGQLLDKFIPTFLQNFVPSDAAFAGFGSNSRNNANNRNAPMQQPTSSANFHEVSNVNDIFGGGLNTISPQLSRQDMSPTVANSLNQFITIRNDRDGCTISVPNIVPQC